MYQRRLAVAVRAVLCLTLAWIVLSRSLPNPISQVALRTIAITATIVESNAAGAVQNLIIQAYPDGRLYTVFTHQAAFSPGDRINIYGTVRAFESARNPGAFSEQAYAQTHGLSAAIDNPQIRLLDHAPSFDCRFWPARFRRWAKAIVTGIFPSDEAAIFTGMLWGDHHALSYEDTTAFSATGTSHLLVTAGLHLGFFAALIRLLLRLMTLERSLAAALTMLLTWLLCVISNAHTPSVRAATMISAMLCAEMLGTKATSWQTLGYALFITLSIEPSALGDASWYLSFSCVFAIVHIAAAIEVLILERHIPGMIAKSLAITCAAQIGTWALITAQFHQISFVAPLANLIAVPQALLALSLAPLLFIGNALHCTVLTAAAATPLHIVLLSILAVVRACAHLPIASINVRTPALWTLVCYECTLAISAWICSSAAVTHLIAFAHLARAYITPRQRKLIVKIAFHPALRRRCAIILLIIASVTVYASTCCYPRELRITMLDVGQGDGIVIETPHGHTILIDTGGRLELHAHAFAQSPAEVAAMRVLLPFLQYEGITHIDVMLLTHPHGDHAGGAAPVLRSLPVQVFLDSGQSYTGNAYQDAVREAVRTHVPRIIAERGQVISFDDGVILHVLAPAQPLFRDGRNDINENSIIVMLTYQHIRMLFTGDAGEQAETRLLAQGDDLHADFLKVGHHGSAYASSAAFLQAVHPRIALISVGQHNLFHHPALPTLQRLRTVGAQVYRTDQCGAIIVRSDEISTMLPCAIN